MLQMLISEQEAKQACLKQQRMPKTIQRDASIQCDRTEAATPPPRQTSDVALQTDFVDVMARPEGASEKPHARSSPS